MKLVDLDRARPALSVVQRAKSAAAAALLHAHCSGAARRPMRWRAPHRQSGEAAPALCKGLCSLMRLGDLDKIFEGGLLFFLLLLLLSDDE